MAKKRVSAKAFVNATLQTSAPLTFIDPDTGEGQTDDFKIIYYALSSRRRRELDEWVADFNKKVEALNQRAQAHHAAEAQRRLRHDAAEAEREEKAREAGEPFTPAPFEERPFDDPEAEELRYADARFVAKLVHSIPEILDAEGEKPLVITAEALSEFSETNVQSIRASIERHSTADPTKPASSPSS
jgi:hypothetical protein